jgi:hypothetical protein
VEHHDPGRRRGDGEQVRDIAGRHGVRIRRWQQEQVIDEHRQHGSSRASGGAADPAGQRHRGEQQHHTEALVDRLHDHHPARHERGKYRQGSGPRTGPHHELTPLRGTTGSGR